MHAMAELLEVSRERFDYEAHVRAHLASVRSAVLAAFRTAGEDVAAQKEVLRVLEAHKVVYLDFLLRTCGERCFEPRSEDDMGNLIAGVLRSIPGDHQRRDEFLAQMAKRAHLKAEVAEPVAGVDHELVLDIQEHLSRVQDAVLNVIQYARRDRKDQFFHSVRLFTGAVMESLSAAA